MTHLNITTALRRKQLFLGWTVPGAPQLLGRLNSQAPPPSTYSSTTGDVRQEWVRKELEPKTAKGLIKSRALQLDCPNLNTSSTIY